ncbi:MAG: WD40/YVTN/BNR-like repeat-containing protein [Anaerolineales bacterium]
MKTHKQLRRLVTVVLSMGLPFLPFTAPLVFSQAGPARDNSGPLRLPSSLYQEQAGLLAITPKTINPLTGQHEGTPLRVSEVKDFGTTAIGATDVVKQFEETSYYLKDVDFVSDDIGWAVGHPHWNQTEKRYKGTVIKTVDGGATWTAQEAGFAESFRTLSCVDADNCWVAGENGTILHTDNGGSNWVKQSVETTDEIRDVTFVDTNYGWAVSNEPVLWDYFGDAIAWEPTIWHTNNGGQIWGEQNLPENAGLLHGLKFIDGDNGWAVGIKCTICSESSSESVGVVYHTSNGGATWTEQWTPDLDLVFTAVEFVDASNGWVTGFKGSSSVDENPVYHTSDGGATWERQSGGDTPGSSIYEPLWDIGFLDQNRGYIVGINHGSGHAMIYRTLDGGTSWEWILPANHEGRDGLYGIAMKNNKVLAVGDHDYVVISDDPWGATPGLGEESLCSGMFINVHYKFESVFFTDENRGWAVGARSYVTPTLRGQIIFHTNDGGTTWQKQYEASPKEVYSSQFRLDSVFFIDAQNGWAVGHSETYSENYTWEHRNAILHTTDGGETWQDQGQELYDLWDLEFVSVQFLDSQNGWALAAGKTPSQNIHLAQTTDAGTHWQWVDTGIEGYIGGALGDTWGEVHFADTLHGWAVGGSGVVHTEDGGLTWSEQIFPDSQQGILATDFINNQEGWAVGRWGFGSSGMIHHTTDGGANWSHPDMDIAGNLQDVQFFSSGTGWVVGEWGLVMYTSNGGNRWHQLPSGTLFSLRGLSFIGRTHGWMAGDAGTILRYQSDQLPVEAELFLPLVIVS